MQLSTFDLNRVHEIYTAFCDLYAIGYVALRATPLDAAFGQCC